jgi:hypothetical protein
VATRSSRMTRTVEPFLMTRRMCLSSRYDSSTRYYLRGYLSGWIMLPEASSAEPQLYSYVEMLHFDAISEIAYFSFAESTAVPHFACNRLESYCGYWESSWQRGWKSDSIDWG